MCPNCSKRILTRLLKIHLSNCSAPLPLPTDSPADSPAVTPVLQEEQPSTNDPGLTSVPQFSLAERATQLTKYEVLLLTPEQVLEFNKHFADRNLNICEPLFQAWLTLKNASLPSESQALQDVIAGHTASNIPKKKTTRKQNLPKGPARYNINSPEWENILNEQANKNSKKSSDGKSLMANKKSSKKKLRL